MLNVSLGELIYFVMRKIFKDDSKHQPSKISSDKLMTDILASDYPHMTAHLFIAILQFH